MEALDYAESFKLVNDYSEKVFQLSEFLFKSCGSKQRVYIYGASSSGMLAHAAAHFLGWEVLGFIDANMEKTEEERSYMKNYRYSKPNSFFGHIVYHPAEAKEKADVLLIAASPVHKDAIIHQLPDALMDTNIISIYNCHSTEHKEHPKRHGLIFAANKAASQFIYKIANRLALISGDNIISATNARNAKKFALQTASQRPSLVTDLGMNFTYLKELNSIHCCSRSAFIARDPRDIFISFYYSIRHSHSLNPSIDYLRRQYNDLDELDGLWKTIELFEDNVAPSLRFWAQYHNQYHKVFYYEDMLKNYEGFFSSLFDFLNFKTSPATIKKALDEINFYTLSGRKSGVENTLSHYRKGVSGDWKNKFPEGLKEEFMQRYGDICIQLGYS